MKSFRQHIARNRGMTMMEIVVGLLIFAVLAVTGSIVLSSNLRLYMKANDLAEGGPLLDSIANIIMRDMSETTGGIVLSDAGGIISIPLEEGSNTITYSVDGGILIRDTEPALPEYFYDNKEVGINCRELTDDTGVIAYMLTVTIKMNGSELARREYAVKPLILCQTPAPDSE